VKGIADSRNLGDDKRVGSPNCRFRLTARRSPSSAARGIRRLSLFGSVLHDDFAPQRSDVDVPAEFEPGALRRSGWDFFLCGERLSELMARRVDFCTHLRPLVEKRALAIYDESAS
jgi:predicted nucleotidyltransferase